MKFFPHGRTSLKGQATYSSNDLVPITQQQPHIPPPALLTPTSLLLCLTGQFEGQFLRVLSTLSGAAEAWSAKLRLFGVSSPSLDR